MPSTGAQEEAVVGTVDGVQHIDYYMILRIIPPDIYPHDHDCWPYSILSRPFPRTHSLNLDVNYEAIQIILLRRRTRKSVRDSGRRNRGVGALLAYRADGVLAQPRVDAVRMVLVSAPQRLHLLPLSELALAYRASIPLLVPNITWQTQQWMTFGTLAC